MTESSTTITESPGASLEEGMRADPVHIDQTYDLFPNPVDASWSWSLSEGGEGHIRIDVMGDPAMTEGEDNICYEVSWPEGRHARGGCGVGGLNVQIGGSVELGTGIQNVYQASMVPNSFTMRVWSGTMDTAQLRVQVETWYPEDA